MHTFKYAEFIAHGPIEMLFIAGNILIFALAAIGFIKYFKNMQEGFKGQKPVMGFVSAWMQVGIDFMFHKKFSKCPTNSNRYWGHLFVFYGFMGALVATGIVVVDLVGENFGIPKFLPEHMTLPLHYFGGFDTGNWEEWKEVIGLVTKLIGVAGGFGSDRRWI
jgi:hypothetical protein